MTPTSVVAYLTLFAVVSFLFLFVALLLGRFLRAHMPSPQKLEPYECGEPPIGSSTLQFDLRFYVVALVFVILDVEIAFFFPWATVFGKATRLADPSTPIAVVEQTYREMGVPVVAMADSAAAKGPIRPSSNLAEARSLALASMADMGVFFAVLTVGFAYIWRRGDLNWVRAVDGFSPSGTLPAGMLPAGMLPAGILPAGILSDDSARGSFR